MRRIAVLTLALLAPQAFAQQLDLKTGTWEVTTSGGPLPRPVVDKECMSKADIAQFAAGPDKDEDADCKYAKAPAVSGKTWSAEKSCPGGRSVRAQFTAEAPDRVKGSIAITPGKGQATSTVQISARWLSAACRGA